MILGATITHCPVALGRTDRDVQAWAQVLPRPEEPAGAFAGIPLRHLTPRLRSVLRFALQQLGLWQVMVAEEAERMEEEQRAREEEVPRGR